MLLRFLLFWVAVFASVAAVAVESRAEGFPERPITLIVAYGAGGSTDVTARLLAPYIEKHLGNNAKINVENRAGGGGEIGFTAIGAATPDGYTLGFINTPNFLTIPIEREARFKVENFDPLVNIVDDPGVMTAHVDAEFKTLTELVNYAKANPNKVTVGTTGVGSDDHLAALMLQRQAGIRFLHVPFAGSADNLKALLDRKIKVSDQNLGEALRSKEKDPIAILGLMAEQRVPEAPDLPTFKELGYDVTIASLRGIAAPVGLPAAVRAKLVDAIIKAANDPEFRAKAKAPETFQPLRVLEPAAYAAELTKISAEFRVLWAETPWNK